MVAGKSFKMKERSLGIELIACERKAVTIPVGATIKAMSLKLDSQTVEVLWDRRKIELLTCDLEMRGMEMIERSAKA
jgi:hypothetical protein